MNKHPYPTTAEIKAVVRAAKEEAYWEARRWLVREIRKEYPDSDPKAVRRGGIDLKYGYGTDPGNPCLDQEHGWWTFKSLSARALRTIIDARRDDPDLRIQWIEVEVYPTVSWTNAETGKREEVDLDSVLGWTVQPVSKNLCNPYEWGD